MLIDSEWEDLEKEEVEEDEDFYEKADAEADEAWLEKHNML